jgi:hypothetical protein
MLQKRGREENVTQHAKVLHLFSRHTPRESRRRTHEVGIQTFVVYPASSLSWVAVSVFLDSLFTVRLLTFALPPYECAFYDILPSLKGIGIRARRHRLLSCATKLSAGQVAGGGELTVRKQAYGVGDL